MFIKSKTVKKHRKNCEGQLPSWSDICLYRFFLKMKRSISCIWCCISFHLYISFNLCIFHDLHHCSDTGCCLMWDGKKLGRQVFCRCRGIDPSDPVFVLCHSFVFPNVSVLYLCWPRWPCIGIRIHLLPLLFLRVFFAPGLLPAVVTPYFLVLLQEGPKANDRMELLLHQAPVQNNYVGWIREQGGRRPVFVPFCH